MVLVIREQTLLYGHRRRLKKSSVRVRPLHLMVLQPVQIQRLILLQFMVAIPPIRGARMVAGTTRIRMGPMGRRSIQSEQPHTLRGNCDKCFSYIEA
jgi:hypothetical protein